MSANKNLFVILALLVTGYMGCKDIAYKPIPPSPSDSYFPSTLGSTWKYRDSIYVLKTDSAAFYGVEIDTITFTINGATTDFNGNVCYDATEFSRLKGPGTAYFYGYKHLFALFESVVPYGLTDLQLLVDTASVGYHWSSGPSLTSLLNGNPVEAISTIQEKNISKVIRGKIYTDVYHTSVYFRVDIKGVWFQNLVYYDFYIAKGIGLIEKDTRVIGAFNSTQTIVDYTIK
jgi:hypothetical protein